MIVKREKRKIMIKLEWILISVLYGIVVFVMIFVIKNIVSIGAYKEAHQICTVVSKEFYIGLFQKTYSVYCDDRYVLEVPETVWLDLGVGDRFDIHSYKKVVEP